jgi:hypothetical protein
LISRARQETDRRTLVKKARKAASIISCCKRPRSSCRPKKCQLRQFNNHPYPKKKKKKKKRRKKKPKNKKPENHKLLIAR